MLIFIHEKVAACETQPELTCPHCATIGSMKITLMRTDVSVGLLPMTSRVKRAEIICHHCGLPVTLEEGGEPYKQAYLSLKKRTKTPLLRWSGMIYVCSGW